MAKPDLWMPLYVADYLADTQHLTTCYHGAYLLLLMASWMRGGRLPDDDVQLASICRMDRKSWTKARPVLGEFFGKMDGFWIQKRLAEEYEQAQMISDKNRENGKKGGRPRKPEITQPLTQMEPNDIPDGKPDETPSPPPLPKETTNSKTLSGKPDLKAPAIEVLAFLNDKAGRAYKPTETNLGFIIGRLRSGNSVAECKQVIAKKCREWGGDEKMNVCLRPATLFNKTKFDQYTGELVDAP